MPLLHLHKTFWVAILFCFAITLYAQPKEGNVWCFGTNGGLDFNSGSPVSFFSSINTSEGCATIANKYGNLLFYTDGSNIYNKNHLLMNNGSGLLGHASSTQSGIIVPNPSGSKIYYVFSTSGYGGLTYSIVDTSLNGGLGSVTSKNNPLMASSCEKLNAVRHYNGKDTWVVSHQRDNNKFFAYRVTNSGVDTSAVVSSVGSVFSGIALGYLKFSPDGKKIVTAQYFGGSNAVEIFDFDAKTGKVSNAQTLKSTGSRYYGVEFSASGKYLYIAKTDINPSSLAQYDMTAGNITAIRNSEIIIANSFLQAPGALQLGPDEKIYIAFRGKTYLGVINKPEKKDTACEYIEIAVNLSGFSGYGLPSFNQSFFYRPNADIEYEEPKCGSLKVEIYNIGDTANITSSKWDFGDGTKDSGLIVSKTYAKHGSYLLTNIVRIESGDSIIIDTLVKTIETRPKPEAYFWVNDTSQCFNENLFDFEDSSIYPVGTKYYSNQWMLGDNTPKTINKKVIKLKKYSKKKAYNVSLVVESDNGCTDTMVRKVVVKPSPILLAGVINPIQCFAGNKFTFSQKSFIDTPAVLSKYSWDFGDGTVTSIAKPTKTYSDTGTYIIQMEVIGNNNCSKSANDTIVVLPSPNADFTVAATCHQDTTHFIQHQTTPLIKSLWEFGDGIKGDTNTSPKHFYSDSGQYTTKLVIANSHNCKDSISKTAKVYPKPEIHYTIKGNCQGNLVEFSNKSKLFGVPVSSINWGLDDGSQGYSTNNPQIIYSGFGLKNINLKIADSNGCKDSLQQQHYINALPQVDFSINNSKQCIGENNFIVTNTSSITSGTIAGYNWYLDGTVLSNQVDINHQFSQEGGYLLKLIATTDSSCKDSIEKVLEVYPDIKTDVSTNSLAQCFKGHGFVFDNKTVVAGSGVIDKFTWLFSDNTQETSRSPQIKTFSTHGEYTVQLIMETDKGCSDTFFSNLKVFESPNPNFEAKEICFGDSVYFNNTTTTDNISSWLWSFGDGTTSQEKNPYRKYNATGNYEVWLKATTNNGCADTTKIYFPNLVRTLPKAYFTDTILDSYERFTTMQFTNKTINGTNYLWDFGDGTVDNTLHPQKIYNDIGEFLVSLSVKNQWNCEDKYQKKIFVVPTSYINIPTAFSPGNGDNLNNVFKVEGIYFTKEIDMKIFNRWGQLIFQSNKRAPQWNGRYKGELVQDGAYAYLIRILDYKNKIHIYRGSVTVIK